MLKKNLKKIIGIGSVLLVIAFLALNKQGVFSKKTNGLEGSSSRASTILPVRPMIVKFQPLDDKIVSTGTVSPNELVDISAEASGRIVEIHFEEGKNVKTGDLLVTINNADLQAQATRNGYQLSLAKDRERRQLALFNRQGISQQEYDQVLTELNGLKADSALLKAQLDKTIIRAPFSGILGLRHLSVGAFVSPGTKIVRLASTQPVKIDFSVPERFASYVKKGTPIKFTVENQEETFTANIYAFEPVVDQRSRSVSARALFENKKGEVVPGSFARVELSIDKLVEALQVRAETIIPEMGTSKVFVYRNGLAQPVQITTGLRTESMVQVINGLVAGDTVLTTGLLQLRPGMRVELTQIQ
ncbi:MAG: efflux RND transporter periplasmic adaptor subunit [Bacteroidales bacterium]|nr:efflux RND transporter periplasmic adaptor subunit [Bacteroidales bacterium]